MSDVRTIDVVTSVNDLRDSVLSSDSVLVVGRQTKPSLSRLPESVRLISTSGLAGVIEYQPSEFTFTAFAGTPITEINAMLAAQNQYLPFDPMLAETATIAGTLAAGMSGPGRHRYGGVRDFVLGAELITSDGVLVHTGGKVVKNAAGFDIPKLMVGSEGRLAAITSLTFKVFPRPVAFHSFQMACDSHGDGASKIAAIARGRWECDAIDYEASTKQIWLRLGGNGAACQQLVDDLASVVGASTQLAQIAQDKATEHWNNVNRLHFDDQEVPSCCIAKVPLTLDHMANLAKVCDEQLPTANLYTTAAGSIGWLAFEQSDRSGLDQWLKEHQLQAVLLRDGEQVPNGDASSHRMGFQSDQKVLLSVKRAMDPANRFPGW